LKNTAQVMTGLWW